MWHMIRDGGGLAMLAAFCGVIGALVGIVGAALLGFARRAAFVMGIVTIAFAIASAGLGALGVPYGRSRTDEALSYPSIDASQRARIQEEGYSEAAAAGRVGAMFAALPLLLGAAALFGGAGAAPTPMGPMPPPGYGPGVYANVPGAFAPQGAPGKGRWIVAGILSGIGVLTLLGALAGGMSAPYPNPNEARYMYEE